MEFLKSLPILKTLILFFVAIQLFSLNLNQRNEVNFLSRIVLDIAYYPQKFISSISNNIVQTWQDYIELTNVKRENRMLKKELKRLRLEIFDLLEVKLQNERFKSLFEFKKRSPDLNIITANVIGGSPSMFRSQVVIIDRGKQSGVVVGAPVANYDGIVGRVFLTGRNSSEVILITDQLNAVDALIHRTRARGIVKGTGKGCVMEYLEKRAEVDIGDKVISTGKDGFFPKGIVIGTVSSIELKEGLINAYVIPEVDLNSLEEVFVILNFLELTDLNE